MSHDSSSCRNWTLLHSVLYHSLIFIFFPLAQSCGFYSARGVLWIPAPFLSCLQEQHRFETSLCWTLGPPGHHGSCSLQVMESKKKLSLCPRLDIDLQIIHDLSSLPQVGYGSSDCPGTLSGSMLLGYSEAAMCLAFVNTSLTSSRIIYEPLSSQKRDLPTAFLLSLFHKEKEAN